MLRKFCFLLYGIVFIRFLPAQVIPIPDVRPSDTAVYPVNRLSSVDWAARHDYLIRVAGLKQNQKIVFIGDSITNRFEQSTGAQSWTLLLKHYDYKIINLGIGGDQTQHVIWRLENGEFPAGINPEYVVLLIGTNNRQAPQSIAAGIGKIIQIINGVSPATKIILMGLLPRGTGNDDPNTVRNYAVNTIIKNYQGHLNVTWLDISQLYVNSDGSLKNDLFTDRLHLSVSGYNIWQEKIMELIN